MARSIPCIIMRGGTSKAVFLKEEHLPTDTHARRDLVLGVFGSPDRRQIDGLGGADPLTSKLAIIGRSKDETSDLIYTFGQVGIAEPDVDWHSLCGNISAAVGLYAIEEGYIEPCSPLTRVRVYNTNLKRHLIIEVPVEGGRAAEHGEYRVPGVPGSGPMIAIDFADTAGAATGSLLPTGRPVDIINVEGVGPVEMSLVDTGNAHVFVTAETVGMTGREMPSEIDATPGLRDRLEAIRGAGAARMGMVPEGRDARTLSPATPLLGVVASPAAYRSEITGEDIASNDIDLVSRLQFMQQTHKTYAGTSTACTGVASRIPGTVVHRVSRRRSGCVLRIGHPAGVIETESIVEESNSGLRVSRATLGRTARRIMEGTVFVPDEAVPQVVRP